MPNFLLEIGTEELPASYVMPALTQLRDSIVALLDETNIAHGRTRVAATPRRLTVFVADVADREPDREEEIVGPPQRVAFADDGSPTKAALGFARSQGMSVEEIFIKDTPRGPYCALRKRVVGRPTVDILAERLPNIIGGLSFPKSMRWRDDSVRFARPVRNLLALLGTEIVPFEFAGISAGRATFGHAFLAPDRFDLDVADFDAYLDALRARFVVADIDERKNSLRSKIEAILARYNAALEDEDLLDEVTHMIELPNVVEGEFDERFLNLPAAVIVEAMKEHQKYFAVRASEGGLRNRFVTVTNREDRYAASIRAGNERVLEARLEDAEFFWHEDARTTLESKVELLRGVQFQERLGNYLERTERIEGLAQHIGQALGFSDKKIEHATRAARLCKADLVTLMVGEFPNLQGTMGGAYARHDGEPTEVARGIEEHYLPRHADDMLPTTDVGTIVSLADKFDSIVGLFSVGLAPTGSQDPYALRRQAQGIVRILRARRLTLSLSEVVNFARAQLPTADETDATLVEDVLNFFRDRLFQMAIDERHPHDRIRAALEAGFDDVNDFFLRLDALAQMSESPMWPALVTVVERTFNIGKKSPVDAEVDPALFETDEERELWKIYNEHREPIEQLIDERQYVEAAKRFHDAFAETVHRFFENVYVNVDDERVRTNRLALLKAINRLFSSRIADLSQIVGVER